jgi:hypothetical protein
LPLPPEAWAAIHTVASTVGGVVGSLIGLRPLKRAVRRLTRRVRRIEQHPALVAKKEHVHG